MNAGAVWWGQIGNSLRFLGQVTDAMRDGRSTLFQFPRRFPWRGTFYEQVNLRREGFSVDRRLKRIPWTKGEDPGAFVLDRLCSPRVRADYWPGQSYAAYLGSRGDLVLCDYDVWVTGIHAEEDLFQWRDFVAGYESSAAELEHRAVFLLEYDGPPALPGGMEQIAYQVEAYDCRVFCLELAAELSGTPFRSYHAELALRIGGDDPEFCAALLETGDRLPRDPLSAARDVIREARRSDGTAFPEKTESELESAIWLATVVLLFPVLERCRFDFIARYETELARYLPISNSNGDQVTEPFDLEIGPLLYIVSTASSAFTPAEVSKIRLCRRARNLLAHNKPVSYEDVQAILDL